MTTSPVLTLTARFHLPLIEILYFESSRNYTYLSLRSGKKLLLCKTLGQIALALPLSSCLRVSRSHIVNLHYFQGITSCEHEYFANISDGSQLKVSRRRLKQVIYSTNN